MPSNVGLIVERLLIKNVMQISNSNNNIEYPNDPGKQVT